jgi:outer membrane immunogenic protein
MRILRSVVFAAAAVSAIVSTSATWAADLPARSYAKAPVFAGSAYDWTGFYIGLNAGGAASGTGLTTDPQTFIGTGARDNSDNFKFGVTGGIQGGYNWQVSSSWVFGIEGDINGLNSRRTTCEINSCFPDVPLSFTSQTNYLATARARIGYTWDRSMVYVTGGGAFADVSDSFVESGVPGAASNRVLSGYSVGGGIETALMSNWSVKAEYLFADVGTNRVLSIVNSVSFVNFHHEYQLGRVGLNYRFGGTAASRY